MTRINITIQERNGRLAITNLSQHGDELPNAMWENINVAIANAVEKGELIDVVPYGDEFAQLFPEGDFKVYTKDELDFHVDVNWQQVRIQASIAVMQGMIANPQTFEQLDHDERYKDIRGGDKLQIVAIVSVMYADALIAELKKGGDK